MELEFWEASLGVSASGASGSGLVSMVSLSEMLFMFPFKNILVSSFSPDYRKWASGAMAKAEETSVAAVELVVKTVESRVPSLLMVMGRLVESFTALSFILLLLRFSVPVFVSVNIFAFQRVVNFKSIFLKTKKVTRWCGEIIMNLSYTWLCFPYIRPPA